MAGQLRQHRVEGHDLSVWVRLDARLRLVRWLPGFALIVMLLGGPVRVNDRVMFVCHVARTVVVLGPSDVEMKR